MTSTHLGADRLSQPPLALSKAEPSTASTKMSSASICLSHQNTVMRAHFPSFPPKTKFTHGSRFMKTFKQTAGFYRGHLALDFVPIV